MTFYKKERTPNEFCAHCGQNYDAEERLTLAMQKIRVHNEECDRLCKEHRELCEPFTKRGRMCPDCPKDWRIEWPLP